jgi:Lar family restriction alleviation protein
MKPSKCPFCKNSNKLTTDNQVAGKAFVWCLNCGAMGPNAESKQEAIKLWNQAK